MKNTITKQHNLNAQKKLISYNVQAVTENTILITSAVVNTIIGRTNKKTRQKAITVKQKNNHGKRHAFTNCYDHGPRREFKKCCQCKTTG